MKAMEYNKKEINLNRKLNALDKFVIDFISLLDNYVIVSGYVSILFGRSRATEDVDLLIPKITKEQFKDAWKKIHENGFECLNTSKIEDAFEMLKEHAIRFSRKGKPIPNMEFKMIKTDLDRYSLKNKIKVILNKWKIYISPIEMQISYKLFLGSEKDLEDAVHLYVVFNEKLNKEELTYLINKLKVNDNFKLIENLEKNENRFREIK